MSDEMNAKKAHDIKMLEEEDRKIKEMLENDKCPTCKVLVAEFIYKAGIPEIGWLECPFCGTVFCPESVRRVKVSRNRSGTVLQA